MKRILLPRWERMMSNRRILHQARQLPKLMAWASILLTTDRAPQQSSVYHQQNSTPRRLNWEVHQFGIDNREQEE